MVLPRGYHTAKEGIVSQPHKYLKNFTRGDVVSKVCSIVNSGGDCSGCDFRTLILIRWYWTQGITRHNFEVNAASMDVESDASIVST